MILRNNNAPYPYEQREYPPTAITSVTLTSGTYSTTTVATWSSTLSGQPYGNGLYRMTSAGGDDILWYPQWRTFGSETQEPGPHWKDNNFNNGVWIRGTNSLFTLDNNYYGDWVHIQLPEKIVLAAFSFTARSGYLHRVPSKFRIYGSNDGSSWSVIHDQTSALAYSSNKATVFVQSSSAYSYVALVVSSLPATGTLLNFLKWRILGQVNSQTSC
jgi:hypothetical protein